MHGVSFQLLAIIIALRYFIIAGVAWLLFYQLLKRRILFKKIQSKFPAAKDYLREIAYSVNTIIIFAFVGWVLLSTPVRQYTQYYTNISQHGWWYFLLAFPLMFIVHDTYFYWMHRLMHHPKLFRLFHLVHHQSTNPSPWAAFAFHPLEAVVEAGIFPVLLFLMPMHSVHIFVFYFVMMVYNVYGHLGWELYPKYFSRSKFGKWINTSVNHNQHHQFFKGNYGLYFLVWDRLQGTIRKDYEESFEEIISRKRNSG